MAASAANIRWTLRDLRRAVWHLRHGGVAQVRTFKQRRASFASHTGGTPGPLWSESGSSASTSAPKSAAGRPVFAAWPAPSWPSRRPGLNVAVILDDFSRRSFAYEWTQLEIGPGDWRRRLEDAPPDLLFVESAWHGNGGGWRYHLTGPSAPRPALVELVDHCRTHGIPTVFWNKEDPAHFEDFLATARLFDHVFTTDADRVGTYREALGHDRIGVLPFAAQEALHSPVGRRGDQPRRDIAFAGTYFRHRHAERREQLDLLLGAALRVGEELPHGLEIFSRFEDEDERYRYPPPLDRRVAGSLDYDRMLTAYRAYDVFLNVNTVTTSPSMCARRIFEIIASGTVVLSTPGEAIGRVFDGDQVPQVATGPDAEAMLRALVRNPLLRDRMVHRAQRTIWAEHTYGHRVDHVLSTLGLGPDAASRRPSAVPEVAMPTRPQVSALVVTRRPHYLADTIATVGAQIGVDVELVVVMHGFDDSATCKAVAAEVGIRDVVAISADSSVSLGECLNQAVAASGAPIVAKLDDDDLYGAHYLLDQVHALGYSRADVVGKEAHHVWVQSLDATVLRRPEREHRYTDFVPGPTIVARRELVTDLPFAPVGRGEDTRFLAEVVAAGARIYSADRFNFVQCRRTDGDHTWQVDDVEVVAKGQLQTFGSGAAHVMF